MTSVINDYKILWVLVLLIDMWQYMYIHLLALEKVMDSKISSQKECNYFIVTASHNQIELYKLYSGVYFATDELWIVITILYVLMLDSL